MAALAFLLAGTPALASESPQPARHVLFGSIPKKNTFSGGNAISEEYADFCAQRASFTDLRKLAKPEWCNGNGRGNDPDACRRVYVSESSYLGGDRYFKCIHDAAKGRCKTAKDAGSDCGYSADKSNYMHKGSRPNVIFYLVDDWGRSFWPREASGVEKEEGIAALLPSIRKEFVLGGMELDRHYTHSTCSPSRKALLSGRFAFNINDANMACTPLPGRISTMADRLKAAGYATHFLGKWHLGMTSPSLMPTARGFDTALGFYHQAVSSQWAWTAHTVDPLGERPPIIYDLIVDDQVVTKNHPFLRNGREHPFSVENEATRAAAERSANFTTDVFRKELLRLISDSDASTPFFTLVSFAAVHGPLDSRADERAKAKAIREDSYSVCDWHTPEAVAAGVCSYYGRNRRYEYEAMAIGVDETVGQAASLLKSRGMYDKTLMIFSSDNGGHLSKQAPNGLLRGGKSSELEGGIRVVAAVGGGALPSSRRGTVDPGFGHLADWYTTLSFLAGIPASDPRATDIPLDGVLPHWVWLPVNERQTERVLLHHSVGGKPSAITVVEEHPDSPWKLLAYKVHAHDGKGPCGFYNDGCAWDSRYAADFVAAGGVESLCKTGGVYPCELSGCTQDAPCVFEMFSDPNEKDNLFGKTVLLSEEKLARLKDHLKAFGSKPTDAFLFEEDTANPGTYLEKCTGRDEILNAAVTSGRYVLAPWKAALPAWMMRDRGDPPTITYADADWFAADADSGNAVAGDDPSWDFGYDDQWMPPDDTAEDGGDGLVEEDVAPPSPPLCDELEEMTDLTAQGKWCGSVKDPSLCGEAFLRCTWKDYDCSHEIVQCAYSAADSKCKSGGFDVDCS